MTVTITALNHQNFSTIRLSLYCIVNFRDANVFAAATTVGWVACQSGRVPSQLSRITFFKHNRHNASPHATPETKTYRREYG